MKECPYCKRNNDDDVNTCLYCYAAFPKLTDAKDTKSGQKKDKVSATRKNKLRSEKNGT